MSNKYIKYLSYILRHKYFVFQAGLKTKTSIWRLIKHDWSKFLPSEFLPYVEFFHGPDSVKTSGVTGPSSREVPVYVKAAFDQAWLHHQHLNDHHWQHWILREDSGAVKLLEMPGPCVREMVADWMGAGRVITGKWEAKEWYLSQKNVIQLHDNTRFYVEALLGL